MRDEGEERERETERRRKKEDLRVCVSVYVCESERIIKRSNLERTKRQSLQMLAFSV